MRITFVLPSSDLSGGIRVAAIYAQRLKQRGHEVLVVYPPPRQPTLKEKVKSLVKGRGWPGRRVAGPSHLDNTDVPCQVLERYRPVVDADVLDADVVVATWWETAEWVAKLSPSKGAKAYFIQHDETVWFLDDPTWVARVGATWRLPLHKITIARWLVELSPERAGGEAIDLVPNSVDSQQFHAEPRGKQAVATVGVMYATNHFKGTDISLAAMRLAKKVLPDLRFVAFGTQPFGATMPLPVECEYRQRPQQDEIRDIYAKCDAWLFGSRCEGFGLPILEAMACRTPVIGTPAGAAPELLAGGGGILVKPEDPQSMADAIVQVARMPETQWQAMSDAAYATARRYTWDDATVLFEKALEHAVQRAGAGKTV